MAACKAAQKSLDSALDKLQKAQEASNASPETHQNVYIYTWEREGPLGLTLKARTRGRSLTPAAEIDKVASPLEYC